MAPFDAARCAGAAADDLDSEKMARFIRTARHARQFPLPEGTPPLQLLEHLNLLNDGRLTKAAVLLFGRTPRRFLISSEVRCVHFQVMLFSDRLEVRNPGRLRPPLTLEGLRDAHPSVAGNRCWRSPCTWASTSSAWARAPWTWSAAASEPAWRNRSSRSPTRDS